MTTALPVEVWSDVVCPWCCVGRAELQRALAGFEHADAVDVTWRSFELDPAAPAIQTASLAEQLSHKLGAGTEQVQAMFAGIAARGAEVGIDFRFDIAQSGNTFDAHRLLHLARAEGKQDVLKDRLFTAYFTEGEAIGDPVTLRRLAIEAGLNPESVEGVLASDRFATEVRADEEEARSLQVSGVPFFVIDRRYGVSGAQPAATLLSALQQAWADRSAR
jgi:predicted DsbA family dithiol-disulfide isomerase